MWRVIAARAVVAAYVVGILDHASAQRSNGGNTQAFRPCVIGEERIVVCETVLNGCKHTVIVSTDPVIRRYHLGIVLTNLRVCQGQDAPCLSIAGGRAG